MTTIQVRIDEKTKKEAAEILAALGLDMSTAIKAYFKKIIDVKGIPFLLLTENGLTVKQEQEILNASAEAKLGINTSGPFEGKEAIDYLKGLMDKD